MKVKLIYKSQLTDIRNMVLSFVLSLITLGIFNFIILKVYYLLFYGHLGSTARSIAKGIYSIKHSILNYIGESLLKLIISVLFFFFWYCFLTRKKARQLEEIVTATKGVSNGEGYTVIDKNIKGDVGELSRNINFMVENLQNSLEEQRILEKTKTDLITNVSHDLRTPLTSILGYLSIVDEDRYKDEVELRYYVNIAYEKAKTLNVLINDLFELTRMRSAVVSLKSEEIDICELLGQVVAQFYPLLNKNNMEIILTLPEEKIMISVDSFKIVRAFENLIVNAINYGKVGRCIYINLSLIDIENKHIEITVENEGEIEQVDLPHLFDRFYRGEKSRSLETGGSGLGLAITKSIINHHNGDISVYSGMGKTIFTVTLKGLGLKK